MVIVDTNYLHIDSSNRYDSHHAYRLEKASRETGYVDDMGGLWALYTWQHILYNAVAHTGFRALFGVDAFPGIR